MGASQWIPDFVIGTAKKAGSIAVPLSLIAIGVTLGGGLRREFLRDVAILTVVRLLVIPAAAIAAVWWLPLAEDVRAIFVIVAVMPATATAAIMTRIYGGSTAFAATGPLVTPIGAAVRTPIWFWFLFR